MPTTTDTPLALDIRPLTGCLGAEIHGVDLSNLDDRTWAAVRAAWIENLVIFFPGQHLTPADHISLGHRLGPIEIHPFIPKLDDEHPEIVVLDSGTGARADVWHTDVTFSTTPPLASILNMVLSPDAGGDTLWTNQYAAYDGLSAPMKDLLDGLTAVHHAAPFGHPETQAVHPVVSIHPETGRKVLFVNRTFTSHVVEMSAGESAALLGYLYTWSEQPRFQVRYRWTPGAVGMWDNRCTMHHAVDDYDERRVIQRVTVLGDAPVGPGARWPSWNGRSSGYEAATRSGAKPVETDTRTNSISTS